VNGFGKRYETIRSTGRNLTLPPSCCSPSGVAQIYNLLYRRIAFGKAVIYQEARRITNPRYSRVQLCATVAMPRYAQFDESFGLAFVTGQGKEELTRRP